ncbi:MAG: type II glyceraldehyde-3-phosphate dehydrogenase [Desulfurococcales archaeon]|nr:type II glyceraldehyde-3-phosphate dehydrogenase [Desulfurococcales archaeon]
MKVKIAVNGYGTIGKRVADAILKQPDMELIGVAKAKPDYAALRAVSLGIPLYVPKDKLSMFQEKGITVAGTIEDMLSKADVVVDALPGGKGVSMKQLYDEYGVKQIYQGGEKASVAERSFSTLCNYEETLGANSLRVVSCNTTGLLRLLCTLRRLYTIESVRVTLIRRAADPKEVKKGPVNAIKLNPPKLPSHHGEDVKTVIGDIDIMTAAVAVPTTLMHVHQVNIRFSERASRDKIIDALTTTPRIIVVNTSLTGIQSTAELSEALRDTGRPRSDMPELAIFEESVTTQGKELMLFQAVHQESIVTPENIDAIRAVTRLAATSDETIRITDETLGLKKGLYFIAGGVG